MLDILLRMMLMTSARDAGIEQDSHIRTIIKPPEKP